MSWEIILAALGAVIALGGWLIEGIKNAARREGAAAENVRQMQKAEETNRKANEVLGEHRNPLDVDERLRKGDF